MDEAELQLQKTSPELIKDLTNALPKILHRKTVKKNQVERLIKLLEPFQEWPQLIDPHLKSVVPVLATSFLGSLHEIPTHESWDPESTGTVPVWRAICDILYTLCKIRGYKVISQFFNNEPRYIEPLLASHDAWINTQNAARYSNEPLESVLLTWTERYIILLWLSHLMLTPFDLSSISSRTIRVTPDTMPHEPSIPLDAPWIARYAISLAIQQLFSSSKEREAAKILLVRIALRPDMQRYRLFETFLEWIFLSLKAPSYGEGIFSNTDPIHVHIGLLSFLAGLTTSAVKAVVTPFLGSIFKTTQSINSQNTEIAKWIVSSALTRKQIIKILRSVIVQLQSPPVLSVIQTPSKSYSDDEIIEEIVDHLLNSLADKDTPVRFAASKALSVIAAKLNPTMAADIVEAVIGSLEEDVLWDDVATGNTIPNFDKDNLGSNTLRRNLTAVNALRWHGLVLTLAQLLFRRSPPPTQLPNILNALLLALGFEQRSTAGTSVGTSVRDAACFGIWAIARGYSTRELEAIDLSAITAVKDRKKQGSTLQILANELIVAATLDSAGNIRRGASAALQELVGRHPDTVSQGISVIQVVDYHAVALRSRAMMEVAHAVSALSDSYSPVILDGLLGWRGVGSPDTQSRRDTALLIGAIFAHHSQTVIRRVREELRSTTDTQVEERHALILSLAAIVASLEHPRQELKGPELAGLFDDVSLTKYYFTSAAFRAHLIAEAICGLIATVGRVARGSRLAGTDLSFSLTNILTQSLLRRLEEVRWSLQSRTDLVLDAATQALDELVCISDHNLQDSLAREWLRAVDGVRPQQTTYGMLMALGVAYRHDRSEDRAIADLCKTTLISQTNSTDIETKIWALRSLASSVLVTEDVQNSTAEAVRHCLEDHTTDQRGDVGSRVRLEAIKALDAVLKRGKAPFPPRIESLLPKLRGLAMEKLDKVRRQAYNCLQANHLGPKSLSLVHDTATPEYFRTFLSLPPKQVRLEDFIVSASSGSESLLAATRAALATHAEEISPDELADFCIALINILSSSVTENKTPMSDRLLVPAMDVWGFLLDIGVLERLEPGKPLGNCASLIGIVTTARRNSPNVRKLEAAIKIYSGILSSQIFIYSRAEAITNLTAMLLHQYSKIRHGAVDVLYVRYPGCGLLQTVDWTERKQIKRDDIKAIRAYINALESST